MPTPSYSELKKQIAELERLAEEARRAELAAAISEIKAKISELGLTAADLGFASAKKASRNIKPAVHVAAGSYKNPETGEIYNYAGRGRKPAWLAAMSQAEIAQCRV